VRQDRPAKLIKLVQDLAAMNPEFQAVLGPGVGDKATGKFMRRLRERASVHFGNDYSEKQICGQNALSVDFYFPKEQTIVEVALGLPNSTTEFGKDILKAIMAKETGQAVIRLIFISRAGAIKKCSQPGRSAMKVWAESKHGLTIEVHDLPGEPRIRKRHHKSLSKPNIYS
jgi:hypothetical protein